MKTTRNIAKGLSMLCLIGLIGTGLHLHVCKIERSLLNSSTNTTSTVSAPNTAADLSVTKILTPIISQYLAEFLPRLVH